MEITQKEFMVKTGLNVGVVSSVFSFLEHQGVAKIVGMKRSASGKGKPTKIYEIPETVEFTLSAGEYTTGQLAEKLGIAYNTVSNTVHYLLSMGLINICGGLGKAKLYKFPAKVSVTF